LRRTIVLGGALALAALAASISLLDETTPESPESSRLETTSSTFAPARVGPEAPEISRAVTGLSTGPADLFVAPSPLGEGDGSSPENAAGIAQLNRVVSSAEPGSVIELLTGHGAFVITKPISLSAGGTVSAPITVRGPLVGDAAVFSGNRTDPYQPDGVSGPVVFRLAAGADNLVFANLHCERTGNGCFKVVGPINNLTITSVSARNVRRFFENGTSAEERDASISGVTISDVTIEGFSKGAIRLGHDTHNVLISDVIGDSQHQDGDNFAIGVQLTDTVHDVRIERVSMRNARDTVHDYWNGDGFSAESGVRRVHFVDTMASGNTDAGYDLKSSDTILEGVTAEANKRNYRLWGQRILLKGCVGLDPIIQGGTGSQTQVQVLEAAIVEIDGCSFMDKDPSTVVLELEEHASLVLRNSQVEYSLLAQLSQVDGTASLDTIEVEVTRK
jgi:hypothetical protein